MSPGQWGNDLVAWPLLLAPLVVAEILAALGWVPWTTLSRFCWQLEAFHPALPWVFLVGLAVLLVHIVTGFPGRG